MSEASAAIAHLKSKNRKYLEQYFAGAPANLMDSFRKIKVKAGDIFVNEGGVLDYVYVLLSGRVTAVDYRVRETVYGFTDFDPVVIFGALEILVHIERYRTTLAASTDCVFLKAPSDIFARWIFGDPSAMQIETGHIIGYMLEEARKDRLFILLPAVGRMSLVFKNLYEHYGNGETLRVRLERKDLSQMCGLSERTVTRSMKELQAGGCVSKDGRRIVIDRDQYLLICRKLEGLMTEGMEE